MLAFNALIRRRRPDDDGVAMAMVVASWAIGLIAVTVILATVMFATRTNVSNKAHTQAFASAESGRDAALANAVASPCSLSATNLEGGANTAPFYTATTDKCPSVTESSTFNIKSTGYGPNGTSSTIDSTYSRLVTFEKQPGGSLAYFSGTFKLTKSTYKGDVVIRDGDYNCNSDSTIDGDLWIPRGSLEISAKCDITGNIYVRDGVLLKSSNSTVGKSVLAGGDITMSSTGMKVGGDLVSNGAVSVTAGEVDGNIMAAGAADIKTNPQVIIKGTVQQNLGLTPPPAQFVPTLDEVYQMTAWVDLPATEAVWGTDVDWVKYVPTTSKGKTTCNGDITASMAKALASGTTRVGIDYSNCPVDVTVTISKPIALNRDVLFLIPPTVAMNINMTLSPTSGGGAPRNLFFIHGDADTADTGPNCRAGGVDGDDINVPATISVYLMFYTPCGIKKAPNQFVGQYYAADTEVVGPSGVSHWVQPDFVCQTMVWTPVIDLGCKLGESKGSGTGGETVKLAKPVLVKQTEQVGN